MPATRIAIVHNVWRGFDPVFLERFLRSYTTFDAGVPHELIILMKGLRRSCGDAAPWFDLLDGIPHHVLEIDDVGTDLWAYRQGLEAFDHDRFLFLNSKSRILADNWLRLLDDALSAERVGLVGATGSWERNDSRQPFPNPHLRTNAVMARRDLLLQLDWGVLNDHRAALALENGPDNLTRQVERAGWAFRVVGRSGQALDWADWSQAGVFRSHEQAELLVADNRTDQYDCADRSQREWLEILAWSAADPGPNPFKRRRASYWLKLLTWSLRCGRVRPPSNAG